MKIKLRFYLYLLLVFIVWVSMHFGLWPWAQLLLVFLFILPFIALAAALVERNYITITGLAPAATVVRGERASWRIKVVNRSYLRSVYLQGSMREQRHIQAAKSAYLALNPRESSAIILELAAKHCGLLQPGNFSLYMLDPFGFFALSLNKKPNIQFSDIWVLPLADKHEQSLLLEETMLAGEEHLSNKSETEIDEIDRMRPMRAGDRMRAIHWKLSARMQTWMVRQYEKADEAQVSVLIHTSNIAANMALEQQESRLELRDYLLDLVVANCLTLLTYDYRIRLLTKQSLVAMTELRSLNEAEVLKERLAQIPWEHSIALTEQLQEERSGYGKKFYYIFTDELDKSIVIALQLLLASSAGLVLFLVGRREQEAARWQEHIAELKQLGIRVKLQYMQGDHFEAGR